MFSIRVKANTDALKFVETSFVIYIWLFFINVLCVIEKNEQNFLLVSLSCCGFLLIFIYLCLSPNLENFQPLFLQIFFGCIIFLLLFWNTDNMNGRFFCYIPTCPWISVHLFLNLLSQLFRLDNFYCFISSSLIFFIFLVLSDAECIHCVLKFWSL